MAKVKADRCKQQCERYGERNNDRPTHIAQKQKQNNYDEDDSLGEVMQHGMGGVVEQVAAIEERYDFDAVGKDAIVEFVDLLVDTI